MKILLDTHIYLWAVSEPEKLTQSQIEILERPSNILYVSAVSIAEIMIKQSLGKLKIDFDPLQMIGESGFDLLDFSAEDAMKLGELPFYHRDPFDRRLIAQSLNRKIALMSNDGKFGPYQCKVIR